MSPLRVADPPSHLRLASLVWDPDAQHANHRADPPEDRGHAVSEMGGLAASEAYEGALQRAQDPLAAVAEHAERRITSAYAGNVGAVPVPEERAELVAERGAGRGLVLVHHGAAGVVDS